MKQRVKYSVVVYVEMLSINDVLRPILAAANVQVISPRGWFYFLESQGVLNHAK
jgi:hypothetical protein